MSTELRYLMNHYLHELEHDKHDQGNFSMFNKFCK